MIQQLRRLSSRRESVIAAVILGIAIIVGCISPHFFTAANLLNIVSGNVVPAVLALGMAVVLVPAHIDVSVGAQLALVAVVIGDLTIAAVQQSVVMNPVSVLLLGLVVGAVLGAINGVFVAWVRLPAIIVTLGMSSILRGLLFATTNGSWSSGIPTWMTDQQVHGPLGIPTVLWVLLVVAVALWLFIHHTTTGRDILAVGGNREAALRLGVKVARTDFLVFVIMGALSGLAGVLYLFQMGSAQPGAAVGIEMSAIAAAILGGASVLGGRIHIGGTLLGVLLLGVIENALVLSGVPVYWQDLVSGLIVVVAITAAVVQDRASRLRAARTPAGKEVE
ncbi:MAG: ABC transporter permease [Propionicimonas sp.]|uniref:ABC transporter permease n=1 Tax=Propionicimonas sp. TaxID=1955623 RepID=UPI002B1F5F8D|nr:ABC transporter permease [Propionicimonas sp.]MEA4945676.1 ABC transporter permease [Propionicimonas sp.]MEA5055318.1 ABC transporter permease [Propionicimonas sp.]MEA5118133.1 ABC transporter permease [Propionicimonas sp.]